MISIGVNALYLIPGGVGGTEIYLRNLLRALAEVDAVNQYVVFTNRETGAGLVPDRPNFVQARQSVQATFRPARILSTCRCANTARNPSFKSMEASAAKRAIRRLATVVAPH